MTISGQNTSLAFSMRISSPRWFIFFILLQNPGKRWFGFHYFLTSHPQQGQSRVENPLSCIYARICTVPREEQFQYHSPLLGTFLNTWHPARNRRRGSLPREESPGAFEPRLARARVLSLPDDRCSGKGVHGYVLLYKTRRV